MADYVLEYFKHLQYMVDTADDVNDGGMFDGMVNMLENVGLLEKE